MELYTDALNRLGRAGHIYPCYCTRKELRTLAGAPHVGDAGAAYPGTCRNLPPERRAEPDAARASGSVALPRTMLLRMPYSALSA